MNMEVTFTIPAIPVAQPRHRAAVVNGRAMTYEAPKSAPIHAFKATARMAYQTNAPGGPYAGPLALQLTCVFPRPKAKTRKRTDNPRLWHAIRPDCDNLAKSVMDALNGLAWVDDSQIAWLHVEKHYGEPNEQPCVEVTIYSLPPEAAFSLEA